MADCRVCDVFIGFMSRHEGGPLSVYVSKIGACPWPWDADLNHDRQVNPVDLALFVQFYATSDPRADVNHDGEIDLNDISHFNEAYSCGCVPTPGWPP